MPGRDLKFNLSLLLFYFSVNYDKYHEIIHFLSLYHSATAIFPFKQIDVPQKVLCVTISKGKSDSPRVFFSTVWNLFLVTRLEEHLKTADKGWLLFYLLFKHEAKGFLLKL